MYTIVCYYALRLYIPSRVMPTMKDLITLASTTIPPLLTIKTHELNSLLVLSYPFFDIYY